MYLVLLAALAAACSADKLDRVYLPPVTAKIAGGSPRSLLLPIADNFKGPAGSYVNNAQGVVVDAAAPGTRASLDTEESGLGAPRTSYGSTASKVGEAAFKTTITGSNKYPALLKSIPLEDQDPEYQTSIPKEKAIQTKLLQPQGTADHNSNVLSYENNVDIHKYNYGFESNNGIVVGEKGVAQDGVQAQGGFAYKGNDGKVYKVTYTADKAGYQPQGEHLPKPPPVPEEIQKSIEKNNKDEASGHVDAGLYDSQKYNAESDTNKYNDKQQSQFEKRPEFDAPANGASIVQNKFPVSGFTGNTGLASASPATTASPNVFSSQSKPLNILSQSLFGSSFNSQAQPTGFGIQYSQQGLKPQAGALPTTQPGQFGSQLNTQTFQKPGVSSTSFEESFQQNKNEQILSNIQTSNQYPQGLQDLQLNKNDKPSQSKPIISAQDVNSKPFGTSFVSNSFGQVGQTGSVNNAYLPPTSNSINEKPLQGSLPQKDVLSTPVSFLQKPVVISTSSSATASGSQPGFGLQKPQGLIVNQQSSNVQSSALTQSTNNQFTSSQGQVPLNEGIQKYPQLSGSQVFQEKKPTVSTQFLTSSSSLSSQAGTNKAPFGATTPTGQVSQFGSNIPVTTQTVSSTSPSFTSSNSPNYKPFSSLSNTPTQLPYQTTSGVQSGGLTQTTNYQFSSSQGQAPLSQSNQKYSQFSVSQDFQQQKPIAATQSPSSSNLSTLAGTNQSPFGVTPSSGQVSQFGSSTPVITQTSPTSPSFTSSNAPSYKPFSGLSNKPTQLPYQPTPNIQSGGLTQTTNYQFSSSQGQVPLSQSNQKYSQVSVSQDFQQQKPIAATQSPSSSSLSTLAGTNQSPFGITPSSGQVSQFGSSTPVITQTSPTSPSFTSSNAPNNKPLSGLSNKPTQLPYQQTPNIQSGGLTQTTNYQFTSSQGQVPLSQSNQKYSQVSVSQDFQQQKPIAGTQSPSSSSFSTLAGSNQSPFAVTATTGQLSQLGSDTSVSTPNFSPTSSSFTSSSSPSYKPVSGLSNSPTQLPYQPTPNIQSSGLTQTTNYQFSSSQGKVPLSQSNQKYSQLSVSQAFQQQKPIAATQSPSGSSLSTLAGTNQSPFGVNPSSGQVSQFGSSTPVITQTSPTSPSFTSSNAPSYKPISSLPNTPTQLPYQPTSNIQSSALTQTTNYQFSSSQGQVPLNQGIQKYPQLSASQDFQQQKPIAPTQSPSSSSLSTLSGTNQSPFGVTPSSDQVSQFGSSTPVITQTSPTSPSFTSSNAPSYKPYFSLSNTQAQTFELSSQQITEKDKFSQSTTSTEQKVQSEFPQNRPSITQNVFSTQLPVTSQQPQAIDHSYYYSQPSKPFSTPATSPQVSSTPFSNTNQYLQNKQPSYVSVTPVATTSLPSKSPTLLTLLPQKPVQTSVSQSTTIQKPTTSEVPSNVITASANNKPSGTLQNYTPQPTQQYTGELYEYKKPAQELSLSTNKYSATSVQKTQPSQTQSGITSTQEIQQSLTETTSNIETAKPQVGQIPLPEQGGALNTQTTSQEQLKPGSQQFGTQSYKPFASTTQLGSQPLKPFTTTTQFGSQSFKPFGSTTQFGTQTYKPFGSTSQFGSQQFKPFGSTSQFGSQSYKPFGSTYKPFGSTSSFSSQPAKPQFSQQQQSIQGQSQTGTVFTTQSESQSSKPINSVASTLTSQSQTGVQTTKPQLSQQSQSINTETVYTSPLDTQPQGSQPVLGSVQSTSSQVQTFENQYSIAQSVKPITATQTGELQTTQQQLGTQPKPLLSQSSLTTSNNQQQSISQTQFTLQNNKPLGTVFGTSQPQIGGQTSKPQFSQQSQNINKGTVYTSQLGTKPQVSQQASGSGQTTSSQVQTSGSQYGVVQPVKPVIATQTGEQQTIQPKPQFGQTQLTTSNNQQQSISQTQFTLENNKPLGTVFGNSQPQIGGQTSKPQFSLQSQNINKGTVYTSQLGTKPQVSQLAPGSSQTTNSQVQASGSQYGFIQPVKPAIAIQTGEQQTIQPKPQFGQTQLTTSNNQQQSEQQTQFIAESYKPSSTVSSLSEGSLTQIQSEVQSTKPQQTSEKEGYINKILSSQTIQGTAQTVNSQSTKTQFGGETSKPVTLSQTQQQQTTKYGFASQTKPQFPQNQQTFGSQSYKQFESSTPYNFGAQQTKNQFGQYTFPKFGGSHATASASSQSHPGFHFGSQQFGNTYPSAFKSQFGQNFSPTHNTAFASATNGPELYKYNKPTSQPFTSFSFQPFKQFGTASTPIFSTVQPQFGQPTTPSYGQKQTSVQGSSLFGQSSSTQGAVISQPLPSKQQNNVGVAQTNLSTASYGSTATPTLQTALGLALQGQLNSKEETNKGEKFSLLRHPQRFDEKTGYHY